MQLFLVWQETGMVCDVERIDGLMIHLKLKSSLIIRRCPRTSNSQTQKPYALSADCILRYI